MMSSGSQSGGPQRQPPSPGSGGPNSSHPGLAVPQGFRPGQGHPPPHWPYDPRAWGGMHHFMNPQYGPPRPPLDMQGKFINSFYSNINVKDPIRNLNTFQHIYVLYISTV